MRKVTQKKELSYKIVLYIFGVRVFYPKSAKMIQSGEW